MEPTAAPAWESWGSASAHLPAAAVRDEVHSVSAEVRAAERFLALAAPDEACLPDAIQSPDERFHAADSTCAQLARESASSHGSPSGDSQSPAGLRSPGEPPFLAGLKWPGDSRFLCDSALLPVLPVEPSLLDFPPAPSHALPLATSLEDDMPLQPPSPSPRHAR